MYLLIQVVFTMILVAEYRFCQYPALVRLDWSNKLKMAEQRLHLSSASQKVGCPLLPASPRSS